MHVMRLLVLKIHIAFPSGLLRENAIDPIAVINTDKK